ncbi:hypothetical protein Tco_0287287 [Tanacetum coccineum]
MLTSKWATFNTNFQKFSAIHKRAQHLCKSGENEMDALKHAIFLRMIIKEDCLVTSRRGIYCASPKWDAPEPVMISMFNVEGTSGENAEGNIQLFSEHKRPRPPGAHATKKKKSESTAKKDKIQELSGYHGESNVGVSGNDV